MIKYLTLPCYISLLILSPVLKSSPFLEIGDHADLHLLGDVNLSYVTNATLDEDNERDDLIFTLSPGLEMTFGRGLTTTNASVAGRIHVVRYSSLDEFDNENLDIRGVLSHSAPRLDLSAVISFREFQQNQEDANLLRSILDIEQFNLRVDGEYDLIEKTSLGAGLGYSEINYQNALFVRDRDTFEIPLDFYYAVRPRYDLSVGYRYRQTNVGARAFDNFPGNDSKDHFLNVGLRGDLTSRLNGRVRAGYVRRTFDQTSSRDTLAVLTTLIYDYTDRTSINLNLDRDFQVAGDGLSTTRTGGTIGFTHSLSPVIAVNGSLAYRVTDYASPRRDKTLRASIGAGYSPYNFMTLRASYSFADNDSNVQGLSFTNNTLDFGVSLRY